MPNPRRVVKRKWLSSPMNMPRTEAAQKRMSTRRTKLSPCVLVSLQMLLARVGGGLTEKNASVSDLRMLGAPTPAAAAEMLWYGELLVRGRLFVRIGYRCCG